MVSIEEVARKDMIGDLVDRSVTVVQGSLDLAQIVAVVVGREAASFDGNLQRTHRIL